MPTVRNHLFIGAQWVESDSGRSIEAINPATEGAIGSVPDASPEDVGRAIAAARLAFDEGPWPHLQPIERAGILRTMAGIMRRRKNELVELDIAEVGRARMLSESTFVELPIAHLEDMADRVLPQFEFSEAMLPHVTEYGVGSGVVRREPFGVASIITPYNAPFFLAVMKLAPALGAGCTTILKPSPYTPLSAFLIAEIAEEAGLPPGVLNVVTGSEEAGTLLTTHPAVDLVSFTGSDGVGEKDHGTGCGHVEEGRVGAGGKSANIVCDDADLGKVIPDVVMNFTANSGQGCSMLTRTLVHASLHDDLVAGLKAAVDHVKVGDPADPTVTMGPLIRAGPEGQGRGPDRRRPRRGSPSGLRRRASPTPGQGLLRRAHALRRRRQFDVDSPARVLWSRERHHSLS